MYTILSMMSENTYIKRGYGPTGHKNFTVKIKTLEGTMEAKPGDYIIKGILGEYYPCTLVVFEKTYDLVGEENAKESS